MEGVQGRDQQPYTGRMSRRGSASSSYRGEEGAFPSGGNKPTPNIRSNAPDYGDNLKTVYVSNILASMPSDALLEAFRQFGRVENIVRRAVSLEMNPNSEQQYAFVRFFNRQDARYAVQSGEVNFYGRKLAIRARDKPGPQILKQGGGYGLHRDLNEKSPRVQVGGERRWSNHGYRGSSQDIQSTYHSTQTNTPACNNTGTSSTETMSKVLTIANLPSDMSPKELYEICSAYGSVDRSYIYQQADQFGRRFGEVTMGTYFFAHKAFEGLNGFSVRGAPLDVSYKSSSSSIAGTQASLSTSSTVGRNFPWVASPQLPTWPYLMYPPGTLSYQCSPHYIQNSTGATSPYVVWGNTGPASIVGSPHRNPSQSTAGPGFGYPQQYHGANYHNAQSYDNSNYTIENAMSTDPSSRCVSGTSSITLVAGATDIPNGKSSCSPLIVTSPIYLEQENNALSGNIEIGRYQKSTDLSIDGVSYTRNFGPSNPSQKPEASVKTEFEVTNSAYVPETTRPRDPSNLYIKNLDDIFVTCTADLKEVLSPFGQIASAYLATYPNGATKGYGFVAFVNPDDAANAKESFDGQILGRKRVFVTFAERKDERSERLRKIFESRKGTASGTSPSMHDLVTDKVSKYEPGQDKASAGTEMRNLPADANTSAPLKLPDGNNGIDENNEKINQETSEMVGSEASTESVVALAATVVTTQTWRGTQLHGIAEVEEEDSPRIRRLRQQRGQQLAQDRGGGTITSQKRVQLSIAPQGPLIEKSSVSKALVKPQLQTKSHLPSTATPDPRNECPGRSPANNHGNKYTEGSPQRVRNGNIPVYMNGRAGGEVGINRGTFRKSDKKNNVATLGGDGSSLAGSRLGTTQTGNTVTGPKKKRWTRRNSISSSPEEVLEIAGEASDNITEESQVVNQVLGGSGSSVEEIQ